MCDSLDFGILHGDIDVHKGIIFGMFGFFSSSSVLSGWLVINTPNKIKRHCSCTIMETSKLHSLVPKLWDNYDIILGENGPIAKGMILYCHIFLSGRVHLPTF